MTREEAIEIVKKHGILADGTKFESALRELIPELRESEDERIRKDIINLICWLKANPSLCSQYYKDRYDDMLAWLEKQKDSVSNAKYIEDVAHAFEDGRKKGIEEKQKEQKPLKVGENAYFDPNTEMWFIKEEQKPWKVGENAYFTPDKETPIAEKEQKPVDYEAELKKCKDNPLYFYDKYVSIKQKPAEWSEEDEHRRGDAIYFLESAKKHYADTSEIEKTIDWLKSLKPQPKQEWNEVDEEKLKEIIDIISYSPISEELKNEYVSFLKSLRPSWKPSEEQMNGLAHAINLDVYDAKRYGLDSLYNDLKKL